jgi:hypothetical protein
VVGVLLGLSLALLDFVLILHLGNLAAVLVVDYYHSEFHRMVVVLGLS